MAKAWSGVTGQTIAGSGYVKYTPFPNVGGIAPGFGGNTQNNLLASIAIAATEFV
jgi:hypothetical protein